MIEDRTKAPPGCTVSVVKRTGHPYGWEATCSRPFPRIPVVAFSSRSPEGACQEVVRVVWNKWDHERELVNIADRFNP